MRFIAEAKVTKAIDSRDKIWRLEPNLLNIEIRLAWERKYMRNKLSQNGSKPPTNFITWPKKVRRKLIIERAKKLEAVKMRRKIYNLCMNDEITDWENIISSSITCKDLIYHLSEGVLSFRINVISHALPSPNNLRR